MSDKYYGIIYKITNKINGKVYIGQTTRSLEERIGEHKRHKSCIMYKAFKKYGFENFDIETIQICYSRDELNESEIKWIKYYDSMNNGYNLCEGGNQTDGFHHTQEAKNKMSKAKKGKYTGEDNHFYGKHHSEETRNKMSKNHANFKGGNHPNSKKIICLQDNLIFNSLSEASKYYGISQATLSSHLVKNFSIIKSIGKTFRYLDDIGNIAI